MKIDPKVLQQLANTYGVSPVPPAGIQGVVKDSGKCGANHEPILTGNGYEWSEGDNAYIKGDEKIYFYAPKGVLLWVWADSLMRLLKGSEMLTKWVQGNEKYPEGKANSFKATYLGMTGGDEGGGTAVAEPGDEEDDDRLKGAGDISISGTGKRADDFEPKPVDPTDADIAQIKKIAGKSMYLPSDVMIDYGLKAKKAGNEKLLKFLSQFKPLKENMAKKSQLETLVREIARVVSAEAKKKKKPSGEKPSGISSTGRMYFGGKDDDEPRTDLPPQRTKGDSGFSQSYGSWEQEQDPSEKWVEDIANKIWPDPMDIGRGGIKWKVSRTADAKSGEKVYLLKKTQTVTRTRFIVKRGDKWFYLDEKPDHTKKWTQIPEQPPVNEEGGAVASGGGPVGMSTTTNVSPVTTPKAFKKKTTEEKTAPEKTDHVWGKDGFCVYCHNVHRTDSNARSTCSDGYKCRGKEQTPVTEMTTTDGGTSGYNVPGAFSRTGGSKKGVEGSAALGYTLTTIGKEDMKMKADKLYENVKKDIKKMLGK